jgi:endonuclease/exonuclease/phosphatase family metal-dependent hydrolase
MTYKTLFSTILSALVLMTSPALADTYVASWNVEHLGWDNGKDLDKVASIASAFDLIALQEVMDDAAVDDLVQRMEYLTGDDWQSMSSEAVGRGSYKEHYSFVWNTAEVRWVDGATVYIDDADVFARDPFSMRFETAEGYRFVLASIHSIYGDSVKVREAEARALASYRQYLDESFPGSPVYIVGDFNLPPTNEAWSSLANMAYPLIQEGASTLSPKDGRYANLYDNIWAPAGTPIPVEYAGILEYPAQLGLTHEQSRDMVSDHAPVWMLLEPNRISFEYEPYSSFKDALN